MRSAIDDLLGAYDKLIMDPVHGGIPLYSHEIAVLDHRLFQRLRNICQNDILSLVFPGATHSRFLHSVGVMYVGSRMFRAMIDAYLRERNLSPRAEMTFSQLEAIDYIAKVIRLACLLHDSGHSSFSHQFNQARRIQALMQQEGRFAQLWQGIDTSNLYPQTPLTLEHEHYSVRVAYEIFQDIDLASQGIEIVDVLGCMETTSVQPSERFARHAHTFWEFIAGQDANAGALAHSSTAKLVMDLLSSIVSGEIDADRADYMLRDGFHSSVTIGGFNLDHLLSNMRFGWTLETPWLGLAIARKGLGALEDFVYSRHQMYRQVYAHKTALGFDWLLREAINEVLQDPETFSWVDDCLGNIGSFAEVTDTFFWEAFRRHARTHSKSFSRCIVDRIRMDHLETREDLDEPSREAHRQTLADALSVPVDEIVTCTMKARFSHIQDNFEGIKVLVREPVTGRRRLHRITEVSSFFQKFSDGTIDHFYRLPKVLRP
ncbi:MAG: phosphohydrolase [Halomonadaceae bacterium]|nr:MAG: phosphohydrolase [Halomonadaceae bacterium]